MISNPAVDSHSDRGHTRLTKENSGQIGPDRAAELEFGKDFEDGLMEPLQVTGKRQTTALQRYGQIGRELTGKMQHTPSAPVDPLSADPQGSQAIIIGSNMSPASCSTHADRWRVLTKQQSGTAAIAHLVDDPPLQRQDLLKVNQPEQEDLQRGCIGG